MRTLLLTIAFPLLLFTVDKCGNGITDPEPDDVAILFIGNSLTYTNDVPSILKDLLAEADIGNVVVQSIASANYGLQDHWADIETRDRVTSADWDVVIMQQGPSATEGRPSLLEYSAKFAELIHQAGATPAMYMVWPAEARLFDFPGVRQSYSAAADSIDGYFFPSGAAWEQAWSSHPDLQLYGPDRFHPSQEGSYLAAVVMYEQLSGQNALGLDSSIGTKYGPVRLTATVGRRLHRAAHEANQKYAREMPALVD